MAHCDDPRKFKGKSTASNFFFAALVAIAFNSRVAWADTWQVPFVNRDTCAAEFRDETGRVRILWEATTRDLEHQLLRIVVWVDEIDADGNVVHRRYRRTRLSWLTPGQSQELLETTGFEIEEVFGDFKGAPLEKDSTHQVWVARRVA